MTEAELRDMLTRGGARIVGEARPPEPVTEEVFLGRVRRYALDHAWTFYHTRDSRRSAAGFPDCVLAQPGRLLFAELKSTTGKLTQDQAVWLELLRHTIPGVEVYLWTPHDWQDICHILSTKEGL